MYLEASVLALIYIFSIVFLSLFLVLIFHLILHAFISLLKYFKYKYIHYQGILKKLLEDIVDNQELNRNFDLEVSSYHRIEEISNIEIE